MIKIGEISIHSIPKYSKHIFLAGLPSVFINKESQFDDGINDTDHVQSPTSFLFKEDFGKIKINFRKNLLVVLTDFYFSAIRQSD